MAIRTLAQPPLPATAKEELAAIPLFPPNWKICRGRAGIQTILPDPWEGTPRLLVPSFLISSVGGREGGSHPYFTPEGTEAQWSKVTAWTTTRMLASSGPAHFPSLREEG